MRRRCLRFASQYHFTLTPTAIWQTTSSSFVEMGCKVYQVAMQNDRGYDFSLCSSDGVGGTADADGI